MPNKNKELIAYVKENLGKKFFYADRRYRIFTIIGIAEMRSGGEFYIAVKEMGNDRRHSFDDNFSFNSMINYEDEYLGIKYGHLNDIKSNFEEVL